jgi:hypothetical protein
MKLTSDPDEPVTVYLPPWAATEAKAYIVNNTGKRPLKVAGHPDLQPGETRTFSRPAGYTLEQKSSGNASSSGV